MSDIGRVRWTAKKALRRGTALASRVVRVTRAGPGRDGAVRVLTYHRIANARRDPFAVAPDAFAAQIARLAASGRAISLDLLASAFAGQATLPFGAILLTIDDGCASTLEQAAPILQRAGVPAIAFLTASRLGATEPGAPERFLSAAEMRHLPGAGIDVGSHGWTHRSLRAADDDTLRQELVRSRCRLEDLLGREVRAFAYPYGTARDHSPRTRDAVSRAGYRFCFTSVHGSFRPATAETAVSGAGELRSLEPRSPEPRSGVFTPGASPMGADRLCLPRVKIEGGESLAMFAAACDGGLDAWRVVDRYGGRWQSPRR